MKTIDCDIHPTWSTGEVVKRLPAYFKQLGYSSPKLDYSNPIAVSRTDASGDHGVPAGGSYQKLKEQHLDASGIDIGNLTGADFLSSLGTQTSQRIYCRPCAVYNPTPGGSFQSRPFASNIGNDSG